MNSFKKRVRRSPRGIVVYCLKINNALLIMQMDLAFDMFFNPNLGFFWV
jgi:hypothetical protein